MTLQRLPLILLLSLVVLAGSGAGASGFAGSGGTSGPGDATGPTGASGPSGLTGPSGTSGPAGAPASPPQFRLVGCAAGARSRLYTHGPRRRAVAIGFDDGPAAGTPAFVRMLEREHVSATFFLIGEQATPASRPLLLRELRDGDELGDHTFTHPFLTRTAGVRSQLTRTLAAIRARSGFTPCVFRPPYGDVNHAIVRVAGSLGLASVLWDVDPSDYRLPGVGTIAQRVLAGVRPGSIILSHDGGGPRGQTLAAYPRIIAGLRSRGYRIVTISQLLGFRPIYARCARTCAGIGVPREQLPADAIVKGHAPMSR
ncbi:MAG: hypothetical protein NVS1B9_02250 [Solirubrobacteraceae bacterium]